MQRAAAFGCNGIVFFWQEKFLTEKNSGGKKILAKKNFSGIFFWQFAGGSWQLAGAVDKWQLAGGRWHVAQIRDGAGAGAGTGVLSTFYVLIVYNRLF